MPRNHSFSMQLKIIGSYSAAHPAEFAPKRFLFLTSYLTRLSGKVSCAEKVAKTALFRGKRRLRSLTYLSAQYFYLFL